MATSTLLDIQIAVDGSENKELYKAIDLSLELHQEKVLKIAQELSSLLGKTTAPFIVIEYPEVSLEGSEVFNFKAHDYESAFAKVGGKLYQFCNPRNKESIKLLKNVEKEFQKVGKLNNAATLRLSLYDVLREEQPANRLALLNHAKLRGSFQGDPELVPTLTEIIRRISNEFLNSPLMAFLEVLENLTLKLNLAPIEEFTEELKEAYLSPLNFAAWANKDRLGDLQKAKGELTITITLPKLLSLRIKAEAAVLAVFLSLFPV